MDFGMERRSSRLDPEVVIAPNYLCQSAIRCR